MTRILLTLHSFLCHTVRQLAPTSGGDGFAWHSLHHQTEWRLSPQRQPAGAQATRTTPGHRLMVLRVRRRAALEAHYDLRWRGLFFGRQTLSWATKSPGNHNDVGERSDDPHRWTRNRILDGAGTAVAAARFVVISATRSAFRRGLAQTAPRFSLCSSPLVPPAHTGRPDPLPSPLSLSAYPKPSESSKDAPLGASLSLVSAVFNYAFAPRRALPGAVG